VMRESRVPHSSLESHCFPTERFGNDALRGILQRAHGSVLPRMN
jgi:hypothetical protein